MVIHGGFTELSTGLSVGAYVFREPAGESQFDLDADFDDPVRGDAEVGGGRPCISREEDEERFPPSHHLGIAPGEEGLPSQEVGRRLRIHIQSES